MRCIPTVVLLSLFIACGWATAQEKAPAKPSPRKAELSDAQYSALALSGAPKGIAKDAGVVRTEKDGKMTTLRASKNGFNCMIGLGVPMCADGNSMAFLDAYMKNETPPDKLGITYMLAGDKGASNTDPHATAKTADNHWVVTGPHIMILGPASKSLGLTEAADPDPTGPYMMWAGTPYEHAMIPVGGAAKAAAPKKETKPETKAENK